MQQNYAKHIFLIEWVDKSKRKALFEQIVADGHPNDFENFSFYLDLYAKRDPWVMKEKEKADEDALFEDSSFDDF